MTTTTTFRVELLNRADGSVDGHRHGCADIARIARKERIDRSGSWEVTSKRQAFLDYNADFIEEADGDESNTYEINWLPCADHVPATDGGKTTTTKKESTKMSTTPSIPNVRTYDTASKTLRIKALGVDCTIPYCRATPDQSCKSAKGKDVEPHTRRVQRALAMEKAAAKAAAKAKADPKAASKAAAKPADAEPTVHRSAKAAATKLAKKAAALAKGEIDTAEVCKPCKTSHHKQCKGTDANPCGCVSKTHAAA
jgi:hypothetical protein